MQSGKRKKYAQRSAAALVALSAMSATSLMADTLYWDTNGDTLGAGVPASGNWSATGGNWSTDSTGATATGNYVSDTNAVTGTNAVFSAGSDAITGTNLVTLTSSLGARSVSIEEGANTFSGNFTLTIGAGGVSVSSTAGANSFGSGASSVSTRFDASTTIINDSANVLQFGRGAFNSSITVVGTGLVRFGDTGGTAAFTSSSGVINIGTADTAGRVAFAASTSGYGSVGVHLINGEVQGQTGANTSFKGSGAHLTFFLDGNFSFNATYTSTNALTLNQNATLSVGTTTGSTMGVARVIDGAAGTILTKSGLGTLLITGTNSTYTGGTSIAAGTLTIAGEGSLGLAGTGVTFTGSGSLGTSVSQTLSSARTLTTSTGVVGSLDSGGNAFVIDSKITGAGAVGIRGTGGTVLLTNTANDFSGGISLISGTLLIDSVAALNGQAITVTGTTAIRAVDTNARSLATQDLTFTPSGTSTLTLGSASTPTGSLAFGALNTPGSTSRTMSIQVPTVTFSSLNGASATWSGPGVVLISGNSNAGGTISVPFLGIAGTIPGPLNTPNLSLNSGAVLGTNGSFVRTIGTSSNNGRISFGAGGGGFAGYGAAAGFGGANNLVINFNNGSPPSTIAFGASNFIANGTAMVLGHALANGSVEIRNGLDLATASQTVLVNRSAIAGATDIDAVLSGTISNGSLVKSGAGTLNLTATNTYAGTTSITGGRLLVTGSIAASSGVTVQIGGALGGTGTTSAVTVNNGGTISPGNYTGVLTVAGLTMNTGSKYLVDVDRTAVAADRLAVSAGAVNLGAGNATLDLSFSSPLVGSFPETFFLLTNNTGAALDPTANYFANSAPNLSASEFEYNFGGLHYVLNYNANYAGPGSDGVANDISITFSSVPEPASMGLLAIGGLGLLKRRRRTK